MLTALCDQVEGIPISGLVVVGDGQAARSMALSGNAMKVPVLWAKGGSAQLHSGGSEVSGILLFLSLCLHLLALIPTYYMSTNISWEFCMCDVER